MEGPMEGPLEGPLEADVLAFLQGTDGETKAM